MNVAELQLLNSVTDLMAEIVAARVERERLANMIVVLRRWKENAGAGDDGRMVLLTLCSMASVQ